MRALVPFGPGATRRGRDVLARLELLGIKDRVLGAAGALLVADAPLRVHSSTTSSSMIEQ